MKKALLPRYDYTLLKKRSIAVDDNTYKHNACFVIHCYDDYLEYHYRILTKRNHVMFKSRKLRYIS
jgi:hypothetical protein